MQQFEGLMNDYDRSIESKMGLTEMKHKTIFSKHFEKAFNYINSMEFSWIP